LPAIDRIVPMWHRQALPFLSHEAISVTCSPVIPPFRTPALYDSAQKHASGL